MPWPALLRHQTEICIAQLVARPHWPVSAIGAADSWKPADHHLHCGNCALRRAGWPVPSVVFIWQTIFQRVRTVRRSDGRQHSSFTQRLTAYARSSSVSFRWFSFNSDREEEGIFLDVHTASFCPRRDDDVQSRSALDPVPHRFLSSSHLLPTTTAHLDFSSKENHCHHLHEWSDDRPGAFSEVRGYGT